MAQPTYKDLEAAYAAVTFGHDEPDVMITRGDQLKVLHGMYGPDCEPLDIEGNAIRDDLVYAITKNGYSVMEV